ncbi:hypothetical protein [Clostridium sp. ZS2-4]|uniref:hypothetical protein n=1 Tax=Clostridium sp. ZS2-4 TaxID=2987703 RepID=UPI00227D2B2B|nr:hypothetical protein [Clostridium sp. ZS2-4]MCY6355661.1 hypothetical protein [Clostridium sp. ZS2-4]
MNTILVFLLATVLLISIITVLLNKFKKSSISVWGNVILIIALIYNIFKQLKNVTRQTIDFLVGEEVLLFIGAIVFLLGLVILVTLFCRRKGYSLKDSIAVGLVSIPIFSFIIYIISILLHFIKFIVSKWFN